MCREYAGAARRFHRRRSGAGEVNCAIDFDAGSDAAADAGPTACPADCARQYPKGKAEYDTAIGCVDRSCGAECK